MTCPAGSARSPPSARRSSSLGGSRRPPRCSNPRSRRPRASPTKPTSRALICGLARIRFSQDRVADGLALIDRGLAIAERLELAELLIEALITKGSLLTKAGRPVEGMAIVEAARRLAVEQGFPAWEGRALVLLSLNMAIRDPRAAVELEREAISLARRIGRRDMELLLIGNGGEDSMRTGEWDFQAKEFVSLDELDIEPTIRLPMESASMFIGLLRGTIDGAEVEERYALIGESFQDADVASSVYDLRGWRAFADGRFADAAARWIENADMSSLNAPYLLPRVAHSALLANDPATAQLALDRLVKTGAHGRAVDVDRLAIGAGLAALDGRTAEAIAGYRAAIAGWRDLGLPWDEALTSIEFVRFIGPSEPDAQAAADAARVILERLRAARVIEHARCVDRDRSSTRSGVARCPRPGRPRQPGRGRAHRGLTHDGPTGRPCPRRSPTVVARGRRPERPCPAGFDQAERRRWCSPPASPSPVVRDLGTKRKMPSCATLSPRGPRLPAHGRTPSARGESLQGGGQLGRVGSDGDRLLIRGECLDLGPRRHPGQHEHAARADGSGARPGRSRCRRRS